MFEVTCVAINVNTKKQQLKKRIAENYRKIPAEHFAAILP